ncbi:MAG: hypothetical protein ACK56I_08615, partial [bacterium]
MRNHRFIVLVFLHERGREQVRVRELARARGSALRNSWTICFFVALSRRCSSFNRSKGLRCVVSADGGAAARGVVGRPSSPATVPVVAPVGGATAAAAAMSGAKGSRSVEALDLAAAGERLRQRK